MSMFIPAVRSTRKLKIAVDGPAGAGKTLGALYLASFLAEGKRFACLDTEAGRALAYADRVAFDHAPLAAPFHTDKYLDAIKGMRDGGYPVGVLDSLSHQWDGDGGILQRKEAADVQGGNHFTNWGPFTKEYNKFREAIQQAPLHLVCTMRSKMTYAVEQGGKATPKKIGMQPIQRDSFEYEFDIVFNVQMSHRATVSKDTTFLFDSAAGEVYDLTDPAIGRRILDWLNTAKPLPPSAKQRSTFAKILTADFWSDVERDTYSKAETLLTTASEYQSMLDDLIALGTARKAADPGNGA